MEGLKKITGNGSRVGAGRPAKQIYNNLRTVGAHTVLADALHCSIFTYDKLRGIATNGQFDQENDFYSENSSTIILLQMDKLDKRTCL